MLSVCCAPSLYSRGVIMGYKGAKNSQISHTSLLKIEGVNTPEDTQFYLGKVCASSACPLRLVQTTGRRCGLGADVLLPAVFLLSQRVAYVYTAQTEKAKVRGKATKVRCGNCDAARCWKCRWATRDMLTAGACCGRRHG